MEDLLFVVSWRIGWIYYLFSLSSSGRRRQNAFDGNDTSIFQSLEVLCSYVPVGRTYIFRMYTTYVQHVTYSYGTYEPVVYEHVKGTYR